MTTDNYSQSLNGSAPLGVQHHTAGDTLKLGECNTIHTNKGAAGTITIALPAATIGLNYRFYVGAAQALQIDPNGLETISLPSTGVAGAGGKYLTCATLGATVHLMCCETGTWAVFGFTGTWTAEP